MSAAPRVCPKCGAGAAEGDRFCELDGTPLDARPSPKPSTPDPAQATTALPADSAGKAACARCAAIGSDDGDGYCSSCGHRLDAPPLARAPGALLSLAEAERQILVEQSTAIAAAGHPGLRRDHNEDAFSFSSGRTPKGEAFEVLVVCDGVSTSTHAEQASQIAARVACDTMAHVCRSGDIAFDTVRNAVAEAVRAAHVAVCAQDIEPAAAGEPPGTTCVAALVLKDRLAVAWAGDSRAYWLTDRGAELLTRDHSWVTEAVERGEVTLEEALRSPNAHAITRCLGPLEAGESLKVVEPDVVTRDFAGPGLLLLCSDGLWNYYPSAEQMASLVRSSGSATDASGVAALARSLVQRALACGGHDNVSVVIYAHRPARGA